LPDEKSKIEKMMKILKGVYDAKTLATSLLKEKD
jgi:hypothetical protein